MQIEKKGFFVFENFDFLGYFLYNPVKHNFSKTGFTASAYYKEYWQTVFTVTLEKSPSTMPYGQFRYNFKNFDSGSVQSKTTILYANEVKKSEFWKMEKNIFFYLYFEPWCEFSCL